MIDTVHICVAMKPLDGNFAQNALKHGVAGLNIDASRIGTAPDDPNHRPGTTETTTPSASMFGNASRRRGQLPSGRWPANIIHDGSEEVLAGFPDNLKSGFRANRNSHSHARGPYGGNALLASSTEYTKNQTAYDDNGGSAARFFKECEPDNSEII